MKTKRGRKNAYEEKILPRLEEIKAWCRDGLRDKDICVLLKVSLATFYKWKSLKPELSDALKETKSIADLRVENSLYSRAMGYEYEETVQEVKTDAKGEIREKHLKKTVKTVLPDVTAQIFWLKNRKPDKWRERKKDDYSEEVVALPVKVEVFAEDARVDNEKG